MAKSNVSVDDLFELVKDHPEYYKPDGVHFTAAAAATQAKQVAAKILQLIQ